MNEWKHRCRVVEIPGGGPRGFLENSFEGVLGVVKTQGGGSEVAFYCILIT